MKADITIVCAQCGTKVMMTVLDSAIPDREIGADIKRLLFNHRPYCEFYRKYAMKKYDQLQLPIRM